ncbi:MAG: 50S ribosomal protein L23 [Anaerolineae bacterium]|nr:50S ribosomal protein L23 [Anaerolineae bacterium]MDK1080876.1 50S ribosomal protein L23 [Anaerolineae bacterium]MDK1118889.1 50S ribosomal protein L23 [Anaerolineae bacterium]
MTTIYDVLVRPLVTEKSSYQSTKLKQYSFVVANKATKTMVKDAIETLFDVNVERVNIINTPAKRGRRSRSRRNLVRRPGYKKAIITLADGDVLDIFEGVQ